MQTRIILILALAFSTASGRAATNSWSSGAGDYWDVSTNWTLNAAPSITDAADFITNAVSKTVVIDDYDAANFTNTLVISNVTVGAMIDTTNTLFLKNMNAGASGNIAIQSGGSVVPLRVLNALTVTNGGVLVVSNSTLRVDGVLGGTFKVDGTIQIFPQADVQVKSASFSTSAVVQFALGTNTSAIVVSNNLTIGGTLNVIADDTFTTTNYTLFTYGGTLANSGLAVGTMPLNYVGTINTSTAGQVNLVVSLAPSLTFHFTSIARQGNDIALVWSTAGTSNVVQVAAGTANGSFTTNNFVDLSLPIFVTTPTTNYVDSGGATNTPSRFYRVRLVP